MVVLLSGGTGGAKLARGLLDVTDELVVIANTGDDIEVHGVHVSPDPDLVTYWLADLIDEEGGWGIRGDTFPDDSGWFRLGDQDRECCELRTRRLRDGELLTSAHAAVVEALGVGARVLPMSDQPVRTHVKAGGSWHPFQEFMVLRRAEGPVEGVELEGIERARPTPEVLAALAAADVIVIGPSNPVISIGPILALPGLRETLAGVDAPVVAVSPFVGGRAVKGPTDEFCSQAGIERSADGIAEAYAGLLDGIVADEPADALPTLRTDTLMDTPENRRRLAQEILDFAVSLAR